MQDIGMEMETAMLWEIGRKWNKRERKKERGISFARLLIVEWKGKVSRREKSGIGMESQWKKMKMECWWKQALKARSCDSITPETINH